MTSVASDNNLLQTTSKLESSLEISAHDLTTDEQSQRSTKRTQDDSAKINKHTTDSDILSSFKLIKDLDLFLVTAPVNWHENQVIRRYFLNKEEGFVSCVYWNNLYFITGTDIVRCIAYKMGHIGREIVDRKKFEEGIFSDLRALKCGTHAILENSRSPFLKFLHRNQCLRTQKKQKVFFWFSVPHNKLFADVLERDLKRELTNQPTTTKATSNLYLNFSYDQSLPVMEQLTAHFSNQLGVDVGSYLMKNKNMLTSPEDQINEKGNLNTNQSNVAYESEASDANTKSNNNFSDEFPLDFLNATTHVTEENYTLGSYDSSEPRNLGNEAINRDDNTSFSPRHNNPHIYQNNQQVQSNTAYTESLDGIILSNFNQPFFSTSFSGQSNANNQPMYIVSGLPSAIDPKNTLDNVQTGGRESPTRGPQYVPIHANNGVLYNNDQYLLDQSLYPTDPNAPQTPYMLQVLRSQSPSISSNPSAYISFPSSNLIPIAMPSATFRYTVDESFNGNHRESVDKADAAGVDDERSDPSKNIEPETSDGNDALENKHPSQDYMMLSMPSFSNSSSKLNFGLVNGQLFTPGSVGIDYNLDNTALSAGVGISPVIGFNNGLFSAIQYSTSNRHYSNNFDDAPEKFDDTKAEKKLKGILQNDNKSKITKGTVKPRLLNPSLQHIQLDSLFDETDSSFEENDGSVHEDASVKTKG